MRGIRLCAVVAFMVPLACGTVLNLDGDKDPAVGRPDGATATTDGASDASTQPDVVVPPIPPIPLDAGFDSAPVEGCPGSAACERVAFVTSVKLQADLAKPAIADGQCTAMASKPGVLSRILNRTFVAWTSDANSGTPATRFVRGIRPYIRPDNTVLAKDWADLTDSALFSSLVHDEYGSVHSGDFVWTGTEANGLAAVRNCQNWQKASSSSARIGIAGKNDAAWSSNSTFELPCDQTAYVYCFEK